MKTIKTKNGMMMEMTDDGDFYYILPGVLCNRINPDNLRNLTEPQRTYVAEAIKRLRGE